VKEEKRADTLKLSGRKIERLAHYLLLGASITKFHSKWQFMNPKEPLIN